VTESSVSAKTQQEPEHSEAEFEDLKASNMNAQRSFIPTIKIEPT